MTQPDAYVIGSGPNGLAAAVTLARAGLSVTVLEAAASYGGGLRSGELTLPGFVHDEFSAVHPFVLASPFFQAWGVSQRIEFVVPDIAFAHPVAQTTLRAHRSLDATVAELAERTSPQDASHYQALMGSLVNDLSQLDPLIFGPMAAARPTWAQTRAGARLAASVTRLAATYARPSRLASHTPRYSDLLAGVIAHAVSPLTNPVAVAAGLVLGANAHRAGWPIPLGGAQHIADALVADLRAHGGSVHCNQQVRDLRELHPARLIMADLTPQALASLMHASGRQGDVGERGGGPVGDLARYRRRVQRFAYGNGVARVDFAVDSPIPWLDPSVADAAVVHLGGAGAQIQSFERNLARGRLTEPPYLLLSQPSRFDPSRAPQGKHTVWAYTHVPRGSSHDAAETVRRAVEQLAPGFSDTILATRSANAQSIHNANLNLVGGDLTSGMLTPWQVTSRPIFSRQPWRTPKDGVYLCSASVSPGPGVHGMGGYLAALDALSRDFGLSDPLLNSANPPT